MYYVNKADQFDVVYTWTRAQISLLDFMGPPIEQEFTCR